MMGGSAIYVGFLALFVFLALYDTAHFFIFILRTVLDLLRLIMPQIDFVFGRDPCTAPGACVSTPPPFR